MQTPLKASPLAIDHHEFRSIRVEASELNNPQGLYSLRTVRSAERSPENPRKWMVDLTVECSNSDEDDPAPYTGRIRARGWFTVAEGYPSEKQAPLIEVTAASILYGACREMVASFTARGTHGILSIPSVSFAPIARAQEPSATSQRKRAKKKVPRKAKRP